MDQRRVVVAQDRLCFDLISLQTLVDDGLVDIIEPVVLKRLRCCPNSADDDSRPDGGC